jgi:uncharacterized protein (DUF1499 family)
MYRQLEPKITLSIIALLVAAGCASTLPALTQENTEIDPRINCVIPTNCVNSRASNGLSPLRFTGTGAQGLALLEATLASFPEATIYQKDESMVKAVFTTPAGFRDDVIFLLDPQQQQIDFQSHSGFGLYDFGKNRLRMQGVTMRFAEATAEANAKARAK